MADDADPGRVDRRLRAQDVDGPPELEQRAA